MRNKTHDKRAAEENDLIQDTIRSLRFEDLKLDRTQDPMGMNYEWLTGPKKPFDAAYGQMVNYSPLRWQATVGPTLRQITSTGSLASESNEEIINQFVKTRFRELCDENGEQGTQLLKLLQRHGNRSPGIVEEVERFLSRQTELSLLSSVERISLALLLIDHYGPKPKH